MWLGYAFLGFFLAWPHYLSPFDILVYALNFLGEEHSEEHGEEHAEEHHH